MPKTQTRKKSNDTGRNISDEQFEQLPKSETRGLAARLRKVSAPVKKVKPEEIKQYAISQVFKTTGGEDRRQGVIFETSDGRARRLCDAIGATLDGEIK